jgi:uncharacterized protein (TIGR03083 family)
VLPTSADRVETVDAALMYERVRQRFIAVVRAAADNELERIVAPTPAWRVRDVLAHVVGITSDLNAERFPAGASDEWTAEQVAVRRERPVEEIIDEWDRGASAFEAGLRLFGYSMSAHYLGDLFTHYQDVRMTLALPADRDGLTVQVALDFYLESLDEALREGELGTIEVHVGSETHVVGRGDAKASVRGEPFEILRSLSGRRSLRQIRQLDWSGEVDALAPLLSRYPLPAHDLFD